MCHLPAHVATSELYIVVHLGHGLCVSGVPPAPVLLSEEMQAHGYHRECGHGTQEHSNNAQDETCGLRWMLTWGRRSTWWHTGHGVYPT